MARKTNVKVNDKDYFRVRATVFNKYGEKTTKAFYGKSKKEAEKKRDEYLAGISRGLSGDFDKVLLPKKPRKVEKKDCLTPGDINKLFDYVKIDDSIIVFIFAFSAGLRQGELLALNHKDLNIKKSTVNIDKTVTRISVFDDEGNKTYKTLITKPKNASSIRLAPIPDRIIPYLRQHITNEKKKHLAQGAQFSRNSPLFTSSTCTRLDSSNLRKRWIKLQDKLGIETLNQVCMSFDLILTTV